MNPFAYFVNWFKNAIKVHWQQLKHAPTVKTDQDAQNLANHINSLTGNLIDSEAQKHGIVLPAAEPVSISLGPVTTTEVVPTIKEG